MCNSHSVIVFMLSKIVFTKKKFCQNDQLASVPQYSSPLMGTGIFLFLLETQTAFTET